MPTQVICYMNYPKNEATTPKMRLMNAICRLGEAEENEALGWCEPIAELRATVARLAVEYEAAYGHAPNMHSMTLLAMDGHT